MTHMKTKMKLVLLAALVHCGTDASTVGLNAPCTRTSDCDDGLTCLGGVCSLPDAGVPDGSSDASDAGDADGHPAD